MPSPFPGMDPYLESPYVWPEVHTRLIVELGNLLTPQVRPRYAVSVERRVYLLGDDDPAERRFRPDVVVHDTRDPAPRAPSGVAVKTRLEPSIVQMRRRQWEAREARLVVRFMRDRESPVVTAIELLSPANKTAGSHGRDEYLEKREELLDSVTHLVEIDLLRAGLRVPSIGALPKGDYLAHVSRRRRRPMGEVYAWTVRDPLPAIPIPLGEDEADAVLDLGAAIAQVYDRAAYGDQIDYKQPPDPPLGEADAAWARELLIERGLVKA